MTISDDAGRAREERAQDRLRGWLSADELDRMEELDLEMTEEYWEAMADTNEAPKAWRRRHRAELAAASACPGCSVCLCPTIHAETGQTCGRRVTSTLRSEAGEVYASVDPHIVISRVDAVRLLWSSRRISRPLTADEAHMILTQRTT